MLFTADVGRYHSPILRDPHPVDGPVDFVVYDEGNHVCFNIPYKFRPLTADWMAERLA